MEDGEGATKVIEVEVRNAPDRNSARLIARAIVSSNLVKTAIYGEDANWGRVIAAAGTPVHSSIRTDSTFSSKAQPVE